MPRSRGVGGGGMMVRKDYPEPQVELTYLDGSDDYAGFDRFGRIVDLRWRDYNGSVDVDRIQHGYDRAGNRTHRENALASTTLSELYTYDLLHRLVAITRGELNVSKDDIVALTFAQQCGLDGVGNWPTFREDTDGNETWDIDQTRTHSLANEIETISDWPNPEHDAAGNMTRMPKPLEPDESFTATWDAWDRLIKLTDDADNDATVAVHRWDGLGRRIVLENYANGQLAETRHFYYNNHSIIEERVDGTADGDMDVQYVWGLQYVDELIARHDGATWLFALCDANYRVTAIVNDAGAVVERYRYTPYGQRTVLNPNWSEHAQPHEGSFNFRIGHQGLRHDGSGLVYNRARMLHVTVGRLTSRDPLNQNKAGGGYQDGMNLYQLVHSQPMSRTDSSGREAESHEFRVHMIELPAGVRGGTGLTNIQKELWLAQCADSESEVRLVLRTWEADIAMRYQAEETNYAISPNEYYHELQHVGHHRVWYEAVRDFVASLDCMCWDKAECYKDVVDDYYSYQRAEATVQAYLWDSIDYGSAADRADARAHSSAWEPRRDQRRDAFQRTRAKCDAM